MALLDRLIVAPVHHKLQQINHEIAISEKQLGRSLRNLNQKDVIAKAYERYTPYVKRAGSDEEEVAKILSEIEEVARKSAVSLDNVKPQEPKKRDFYKEYSVEIEAEGDMESLVSFLHQLSASSQLLRPEKINLSLQERDSTIVKASIVITKSFIP